MNEHFKKDSNSADAELGIVDMLKKIQQQLNFLEMKVDKLMGQSSERPSFNKDRRFSKPFRPGGGGGNFGRPHFGNQQGDREGAPRERDFSRERQFDKPFENKNRGPERGRKAFFRRQKSKGHFPGK